MIWILGYADGLGLLSVHIHMSRCNKDNCPGQGLKIYWSLYIHPEKSEVLKVESKSREHGRLNGLHLKEVDSFCYLGSMMIEMEE